MYNKKDFWEKFEGLAPAKINLHLAVGARRRDGYHDIASVFCRIGLYDRISLSCRLGGDGSVSVTGLEGCCRAGEDTVSRALKAWMRMSGVRAELAVRVEKHIPVQAGLGGGSSDAAEALRLIDGWHPTDPDLVRRAAEETGSDVPFFLSGCRCAWVTGRGEHVSPVSGLPEEAWVLVVMPPCLKSGTGEAYALLDRVPRPDPPAKEAVLAALREGPARFAGVMRNDFALVVGDHPCYRAYREAAEGLAGYGAISGSGSSWFFVSASREEAERCRDRVVRAVPDGQGTWVVRL